jgi:hypothetical protein
MHIGRAREHGGVRGTGHSRNSHPVCTGVRRNAHTGPTVLTPRDLRESIAGTSPAPDLAGTAPARARYPGRASRVYTRTVRS